MTQQPAKPLYFDGAGARRSCHLELQESGIAIRVRRREKASGATPTSARADAPQGVLRVGAEGAPELARLESATRRCSPRSTLRCPDLSHRRQADRRARAQICSGRSPRSSRWC